MSKKEHRKQINLNRNIILNQLRQDDGDINPESMLISNSSLQIDTIKWWDENYVHMKTKPYSEVKPMLNKLYGECLYYYEFIINKQCTADTIGQTLDVLYSRINILYKLADMFQEMIPNITIEKLWEFADNAKELFRICTTHAKCKSIYICLELN